MKLRPLQFKNGTPEQFIQAGLDKECVEIPGAKLYVAPKLGFFCVTLEDEQWKDYILYEDSEMPGPLMEDIPEGELYLFLGEESE